MSIKYESETSHNTVSNKKALQLKANLPHANIYGLHIPGDPSEQVWTGPCGRGPHVVGGWMTNGTMSIESSLPCEQTDMTGNINFPETMHAGGNKTYQK